MNLKNKFILFLLITFIHSLYGNQVLYMMPYEKDQAISNLIKVIKESKSNIDIAIFSFTNREISKALRDVQNKGVKVRIIYDHKSSQEGYSTIGYLSKFKNIQACTLEGLKVKSGKYSGIMHQKLIIADNKIIGIGSANWSKNAFENSYETLLFTDSLDIIKHAKKYYDDMFSKCSAF